MPSQCSTHWCTRTHSARGHIVLMETLRKHMKQVKAFFFLLFFKLDRLEALSLSELWSRLFSSICWGSSLIGRSLITVVVKGRVGGSNQKHLQPSDVLFFSHCIRAVISFDLSSPFTPVCGSNFLVLSTNSVTFLFSTNKYYGP